MANLNKVMLIGRLTRDPEAIEVRGAAQGAKFGFAVNNRKLNAQTNQWEDVPVFIDVEIWNRGENSRQGERALQTLRKGQQVFLEGHLKMDTWEDKNGGGKRTALRVVVENFQYLEPRAEGEAAMAPRAARPAMAPRPPAAPARNGGYNGSYDEESDMGSAPGRPGPGGNEDDIPF